MKFEDEIIEAIVSKYIKREDIVSFGTSKTGESFMKKIAIKLEEQGGAVEIVPTSLRMASLASSLGIQIATLDEKEVDVAIEFADVVDEHFNYIKTDTTSLVRDKMIAQSAAELIVVCTAKNFKDIAFGTIPFEVAPFGWKRTLIQLSELGEAKIRKNGESFLKTETGNYLIDVEPDDVYSLEDINYGTKELPGVIESGIFIGYADRLLLHNGKLIVKSRLDYSKQ